MNILQAMAKRQGRERQEGKANIIKSVDREYSVGKKMWGLCKLRVCAAECGEGEEEGVREKEKERERYYFALRGWKISKLNKKNNPDKEITGNGGGYVVKVKGEVGKG